MPNNDNKAPLIATFQGKPVTWGDFFRILLPGLLVVIVPLGYGTWRWIYGYSNFGPVAAYSWSRPWMLLALLTTLLLIMVVWRRLNQAHKSISLYTDGLVIQYLPWYRKRYNWKQLKGLITFTSEYRNIGKFNKNSTQAKLIPIRGKPVRLDKLVRDVAPLAKEISKHLYSYLLPLMQSDWHTGKWVSFGRLSISKTGLKIQKHLFNWRDINQISVLSGYLVIELKNSQPFRLPITNIPNLELFFQLIAMSFPEKGQSTHEQPQPTFPEKR